jgi:uncharacterized protein (DUF1778 family)
MLAMIDSDKPKQRRTSAAVKEQRVEARVTAEVKLVLEYAAELQGRTLTDFVVASAYEAATRAITVHNEVVNEVILTARGSKDFVEAVLNPSEPSDRLSAAAKRYRERTGK